MEGCFLYPCVSFKYSKWLISMFAVAFSINVFGVQFELKLFGSQPGYSELPGLRACNLFTWRNSLVDICVCESFQSHSQIVKFLCFVKLRISPARMESCGYLMEVAYTKVGLRYVLTTSIPVCAVTDGMMLRLWQSAINQDSQPQEVSYKITQKYCIISHAVCNMSRSLLPCVLSRYMKHSKFGSQLTIIKMCSN